MNINRVLNSCFIPQKAGKILGPMAKIIEARKQTVSACQDAPQIPPFRSAVAAHSERTDAANSQT